jgi:hypothetical protein
MTDIDFGLNFLVVHDDNSDLYKSKHTHLINKIVVNVISGDNCDANRLALIPKHLEIHPSLLLSQNTRLAGATSTNS